MIEVPYLLFITIAAVLTWWLSGYDTRVTGENKRDDAIRRAVRCGVTLVLLTMGVFERILAIPIALGLAFIWMGCLTEFCWRVFIGVTDPEDKRPFDAKETERNMDHLSGLIAQGRKSEALAFCTNLEKSGSASHLAVETMVHRLYTETLDSIERSPFLANIRRWREQKHFAQAESELQNLLARQPDNWAATLLLARVYVEDFAQPNRALVLVNPGDKPSPLPIEFIKYARQSIQEWSAAASQSQEAARPAVKNRREESSEAPAPEPTIEELLKGGQLSTAIDRLENAIKDAPENFDLWLALIEAHAVYCADPLRAGKNFSPDGAVVRIHSGPSRYGKREAERMAGLTAAMRTRAFTFAST